MKTAAHESRSLWNGTAATPRPLIVASTMLALAALIATPASTRAQINHTAYGTGALSGNTGSYCSAFGAGALSSSNSGNSNAAFGNGVLSSNISGSGNQRVREHCALCEYDWFSKRGDG